MNEGGFMRGLRWWRRKKWLQITFHFTKSCLIRLLGAFTRSVLGAEAEKSGFQTWSDPSQHLCVVTSVQVCPSVVPLEALWTSRPSGNWVLSLSPFYTRGNGHGELKSLVQSHTEGLGWGSNPTEQHFKKHIVVLMLEYKKSERCKLGNR